MSKTRKSSGRASAAPELAIREHWLCLQADLDRMASTPEETRLDLQAVRHAIDQVEVELQAPSEAGARRAQGVAQAFRRTDPWERRLRAFLSLLDPSGRRAFSRLVALGLNPDVLADVVVEHAKGGKSRALDRPLRAFRAQLASIVTQCRSLANSYEQLLRQSSSLAFPEDQHLLPAYLRERADHLKDLRDSVDPRRQSPDRHVAVMCISGQLVAAANLSGAHQEALFVDVLNAAREVHGRAPITSDSLRKLVERQLAGHRLSRRPSVHHDDAVSPPFGSVVTTTLVIAPVEHLRPVQMPLRRSKRRGSRGVL